MTRRVIRLASSVSTAQGHGIPSESRQTNAPLTETVHGMRISRKVDYEIRF